MAVMATTQEAQVGGTASFRSKGQKTLFQTQKIKSPGGCG